ncbi:hypothetical protein [Vibrio coralliilyticus]|uniref:hypothetical protein n=1 Tax=Vibrio coralliilyticus TaxID=190893 RepID=UPI00148BDE88|nr:hypothetical protein [Vibrio coralliilyticus]NOI30199.1 hypothetical protein [Vibrio coralliilyticus]NOI46827.1 hypothetical protein [Vibrio coralliilyticus]
MSASFYKKSNISNYLPKINKCSSRKPVYLVGSRCGGGKTKHTLEKLASTLINTPPAKMPTIVFASLTNKLSEQSYDNFQKNLSSHNKMHSVQYRLLTSDRAISRSYDLIEESPVAALSNLLHTKDEVHTRYKGVIFCTHSALSRIDPSLLNGATVIMDELPASDLGKVINCALPEVAVEAGFITLMDYLHIEAITGSAYSSVRLKEDKKQEAEQMLRVHEQVGSGMLSQEGIDVINYLVHHPYADVMYKTVEKEDVGLVHMFQALDYRKFFSVLDGCKKLYLLTASFNSSVVGYLLSSYPEYEVVEDVKLAGALPQVHKRPIKVIPFLNGGQLSTTLRKSLVTAGLKTNATSYKKLEAELSPNIPTSYVPTSYGISALKNLTVDELLHKFVEKHLEQSYLLFVNKENMSSPFIDIKGKNVQVLSTAVHGLNSFTEYRKAAFVATLRPTRHEETVVKFYAQDTSLSPNAILKALYSERMYEPCYQCLARTAIRMNEEYVDVPVAHENTKYIKNDEGELEQVVSIEHTSKLMLKDELEELEPITFIVPDMEYVKYLETKFDEGMIEVDTSYSFVANNESHYNKKGNRLDKAVAFFMDKANKPVGAPMSELYEKHGVNQPTVSRWKREFYAHLLALKLIKPSKKQELKKLVKEDNVAVLPISSLKDVINTEQGAA